jgi:hypothetical protein
MRHAVAGFFEVSKIVLDSQKTCANFCLRRNDAPLGEGSSQKARKARLFPGNERGVRQMADKEFEITTNTYIFAAVGGVLLGGLAGAALGGLQNIIAAGVVGALAGGCLGLFF